MDASNTSSYSYHYDANWNLIDGTSTWNGETTTYGANWVILSQARTDLTGLTTVAADSTAADLFGADAKYADDGFGGRTYYDATTGAKLGTSYTSTWDDGQGFTSTNTGYNDDDWNWLGSEWSDSNGNAGTSSRVTQTDGSFIESGTWAHGTNTSSYSYHYDSSWNLLDGTSTWNGETTTYGANWVILSQARDVTNLTQVGAESMAADLFGADAKYADDGFGGRTYYDATTGAKLGTSYTNTWTEGSNTGYNDANSNWIGSEIQDSLGSGWNTRTVESVSFDFNGDGTVATDATETNRSVIVERGEFTEINEITPRDSREYYYSNDGNQTFLGGTSTWNGETTTYGANWVIISQARTDLTGLTTVAADSVAADLFGVDAKYADDGIGGRTYYDASGNKLGTSYTSTWTEGSNTGYNDANWNWIGSESQGSFGSGWNTRTENEVTTFDFTGDGTVDGADVRTAIVERGEFTRTGETTPQEEHEFYYSTDGSLTFLGGTSTMNGNTIVYGENWTIISSGGGGGPIDPNDTTIPAVVGASFTEGANSTITLRFSEAVTWSGTGSPMLSFFKNPDYSDGWSQAAYNAALFPTTGYSVDTTANTISFTTNVTLSSTDVVQAQYSGSPMPMHGELVDAGGNPVPNGEIWFGGSGTSTINLDNYGSWLPIQIRGNGGSDTLTGTSANDTLIDGGGADTLIGGEGSDAIVLVENGGTVPHSRDVVFIQPGDSIVGARDVVKGSATSPSDTGFDIASVTAGNHDVLSLPSAVIAGNTTGIVDGTDSAGGISGHSISNGIVSFYNTGGTSLAVVFNATDAAAGTRVTSADAVAYLAANIHEVGATVGFKVDVNNDGNLTNSDSLVVFQDIGTLATQGGIAPPDTLVTLSGLIGVASATLGNTEGANVVQLVDVQGPEVIGFGLTTDGFQLDFTENALMPTVQANLALTMKKSGTIDVAFTGVDGSGTSNWTVHTNQTFTQDDWVLINYAGSDSSNGFHDALGNVMVDQPDPGYGGTAEGGGGNTVIDLSNSAIFSAAGGYDLEGAPGNDTLIGSAGSDWLEGGTGADLMTGGAGEDEFAFNPGDGTALSYATGVYSFAGGTDVITDFAPGDAVYLNLPANRDWAATSPAGMGDGDYILVAGDYSGGSFHENTATGADTLLVYDGDASSNFAATGVVLSGVMPSEFNANGNYITLMQQTSGGDTTAPVLQSAVVNGATLTLTYNELLDASSSPLASDFMVGTGTPPPLVPSSVAVSGATVTLTLPTAVAAGATVTLGYQGTTLQDVAGNDAANLFGQSVTNNTSGTASGATYINWTNNYTDAVVVTGSEIAIQVHFSNAVVVDTTNGTPSLSLDIYNDDGSFNHSVQAGFQQYINEGFNPAFGQNSMVFVYTATATDKGTFHIGNVNLNGGSIISNFDQLPANLTLDSSNRTITAGNYLYGDAVATGTGTAGNDALGVYEANPALVQVTDGQYVVPTEVGSYAVTGGDGSRDVLGVPVVLPGSVTTAEVANGYYLKYDAANSQIKAFAPDGSVATTLSVPASFPAGVEQLIYHLQYFNGTTYQDANASEILLANGVATYTDAAVAGEHFVRGSRNADTIDLSAETDAAARYTVRGGAGNDTITGSLGNDAIQGEGGANVINAGAGNDAIFVANNGNNTVADGGAGTDRLVFELPGQQMAIVNRIMGPAIQSQEGTWGETGFTPNTTTNLYRLDTDDSGALIVMDYTTLGRLMTATNVEALQFRFDQWDGRMGLTLQFGTAADDTLGSTTGMMLLSGGAGNDTLAASNLGNDILMGGGGNDILVGGTARDLLYGGADYDQMNAGGGNDWLVGGSGNDSLNGGDGTNDSAGYAVHASGTATPTIAWSEALNGHVVSQSGGAGAGTALALVQWNAGNGNWTVTDLSVVDPATSFGTDSVSNVEYLSFDQDAGGISALTVDLATLTTPSSTAAAPTLVGASFSTAGSITLTFSEDLMTLDAQPLQGLSWYQNPDPANGNQGATIVITGSSVSGLAYTFQTSTTLLGTDVLKATYDATWGNLGNAAGTELTGLEVWFGGNVNNTIDLENYGSSLPIQMRGNGGMDTLIGTGANDTLIDGGGADTLIGSEGSDAIVLVENGGSVPHSRDVVFIRPGDSIVGARDLVKGSATSPSDTGFDIASGDATKHDQLSLPSAIIAGDSGMVAGAAYNGIAQHSIASGIVSFYTSGGDAVAMTLANSADGVSYLSQNINSTGSTVAFKVDADSNGAVDSLVVFQDAGILVTQGGLEPPDTLVTLSGLIGVASATLGNTQGVNVVQLVDVQGPEIVGFGLTANGFQLDFTENALMPTGSLALTMQKSGVTTVAFTNLAGDGTANWTVTTDQSFTQEDWVLINYGGTNNTDGFRDALGNVMMDDSDPGYGGSAEGGSGNNSIDLSAFTATGGYDLNGNGGNDTLTGSAYEDWLSGGTGADTMTGGGGPDEFELRQGDSPLATLANGVYSFAGGAADVITDFGADDAIWIDMRETSSQTRSFGDSSYEVVQGSYAGGLFTAGAGADTLLVYDGDSTVGAVMTGVVLSNVTAMNLMTFGNYITLNTQPV
ncbi:MAG: hypothetical protein HYY97_16290 [Rhodocyclales bacterium]|nr:hypothetical protein [Rhodocyclales bacterium]